MTKEELNNYENLQDTFQTRCERICHILSPLEDAYNYVYEFEIDHISIGVCKSDEYLDCVIKCYINAETRIIDYAETVTDDYTEIYKINFDNGMDLTIYDEVISQYFELCYIDFIKKIEP